MKLNGMVLPSFWEYMLPIKCQYPHNYMNVPLGNIYLLFIPSFDSEANAMMIHLRQMIHIVSFIMYQLVITHLLITFATNTRVSLFGSFHVLHLTLISFLFTYKVNVFFIMTLCFHMNCLGTIMICVIFYCFTVFNNRFPNSCFAMMMRSGGVVIR